MNWLKVRWHCHRNKGHKIASYQTALGFRTYYCETCRYGLNDFPDTSESGLEMITLVLAAIGAIGINYHQASQNAHWLGRETACIARHFRPCSRVVKP